MTHIQCQGDSDFYKVSKSGRRCPERTAGRKWGEVRDYQGNLTIPIPLYIKLNRVTWFPSSRRANPL